MSTERSEFKGVATQLARSTIQKFKIGHKTSEISKDFLCWDFPKREDQRPKGANPFKLKARSIHFFISLNHEDFI